MRKSLRVGSHQVDIGRPVPAARRVVRFDGDFDRRILGDEFERVCHIEESTDRRVLRVDQEVFSTQALRKSQLVKNFDISQARPNIHIVSDSRVVREYLDGAKVSRDVVEHVKEVGEVDLDVWDVCRGTGRNADLDLDLDRIQRTPGHLNSVVSFSSTNQSEVRRTSSLMPAERSLERTMQIFVPIRASFDWCLTVTSISYISSEQASPSA
jgi:hypothetical protein